MHRKHRDNTNNSASIKSHGFHFANAIQFNAHESTARLLHGMRDKCLNTYTTYECMPYMPRLANNLYFAVFCVVQKVGSRWNLNRQSSDSFDKKASS